MNGLMLAIARKLLKQYLTKELLERMKNEFVIFCYKKAKETETKLDDEALRFLFETVNIDDHALAAVKKLLDEYLK